MRSIPLGAALVAAATLLACAGEDDPTAPATPPTPAAAPDLTISVAPALHDALTDARMRVLPALDAAARAPLEAALAALGAALDAGDGVRAHRAIAAVRTQLAHHAAVGSGADRADGADAAALRLLTDLVAAEIRAPD